jgi:hypothetical protein
MTSLPHKEDETPKRKSQSRFVSKMSFNNEHSMVEDLVELSNEEDKGELFV